MYNILGIPFGRLLWILWPLRFFLRLFVLPDIIKKEDLLNKAQDDSMVFVLPHMSFVDTFVLNVALKRLGLPKVKRPLRPNMVRRATLLALKPPTRFPLFVRQIAFEEYLAHFIDTDARTHLLLVPISVFWGKIPDSKDKPFLVRMLFPDDGRANALQKVLLIAMHSRDLHIHFGSPIRQSIKPADGESSLSLAQKIRRTLLIDFKRERTAALGPAVYDFDAIAELILAEPETLELVKSIKEKPEKTEQQIVECLSEIAADYNRLTVRYVEEILDFVWTRIFTGVRVRGFDGITETAKIGQIIWMPCHRSHLDYLLLSYLLSKKGLVVPHTAAGINLNFWPIGSVLRRGGAFFLRRTFQGNRIYTHTFVRYVDYLMRSSFPLEFFQEGGRSRIGKLLVPKRGMLTFCVGSIISRRAENAYIMPVYFGYEKVLEDQSYAKELQGGKKQAESVFQLIGALRKLFSTYGTVDVSFGKPLKVSEVWTQYFSRSEVQARCKIPAQLREVDPKLDQRTPEVQNFVKYLARRVNEEINVAATASGSSLLASILLSLTEPFISRELFVNRIRLLHWSFERLNRSLHWRISTCAGTEEKQDFVLSDVSENIAQKKKNPHVTEVPFGSADLGLFVETVLNDAHQWGFLQEKHEGETQVFFRNPQREFNLWWYRGTIFHVLAIPGLIAAYLIDSSEAKRSLLQMEIWLKSIRALWEDELFWPEDVSDAALCRAALDLLSDLEILTVTGSQIELAPYEAKQELLRFYADLVRPERELYGLMVATGIALGETKGKFTRDALLSRIEIVHRSAFLRGVAIAPANLSHVFGRRVFDALQKNGMILGVDAPNFVVSAENISPILEFFEVPVWREFLH